MITHNIEAVQERLRLLEAELPKALLRALDPGYWHERLKTSATNTLRKCWESERSVELHEFYERLTPQMVATIMAAYSDNGLWCFMAVPQYALSMQAMWPDLTRAIVYNASLLTPTGRPTKGVKEGDPALLHPEEHQNLERVRQIILDWVTFEKDWDERDYHADGTPCTPQERAERIMDIIGVGKPGLRTQEMDDAADSLAGAIDKWLCGEGSTSPEMAESARAAEAAQYGERQRTNELDPELAHEWLRKVLDGWVKLVRQNLPVRIERELEKLRAKLKQPELRV
jgi:hypothetical protein